MLLRQVGAGDKRHYSHVLDLNLYISRKIFSEPQQAYYCCEGPCPKLPGQPEPFPLTDDGDDWASGRLHRR